MNELAIVALSFGGMAAAIVFFIYIRSEKGKLRKSVLEYENIKKKLNSDE